ncbi:PRS6B protein, partial [Menura novaehollandiae]|nr:PRS6B protein [Menura novaehollandiae]
QESQGILKFPFSQDDVPASAAPRAPPGLSFLVPEPEDLEDLYSRYKKLQQELEFLEVQEEYIKDEQRNLKKEFLHAQEEVKRIQSIPLVIGQFLEAVDQNTAIVGSTTGSNYYVRILSTIDRELLKPNASVALHKHSNALVDVLPPEADSSIMMLTSVSMDSQWDFWVSGGISGFLVELWGSWWSPWIFTGIFAFPVGFWGSRRSGWVRGDPNPEFSGFFPAAFIRVVGSEFVQKYLGEGPRMVRDVFRLAKENAPAIIFIDEIDAIATKRFDAQTGADREVQRILLELLNQMDGFDQNVNVKVIMATNRADTLDPALLRPGRLDRKIEFPLPDRRQKRLIFSTITGKMNLSEEVDLEDCIRSPGHTWGGTWGHLGTPGGAGGMLAVRENRYIVLAKDFEKAYKTVIKKDEQEHEFYK